MHRAAVAVMVGCAFGGIGSGVGHQHEISDVRLTAVIRSVTKKAAAMTAKAAAPAMKTVEYGGYAVKVPATWPVYLLSKDPGQCVRYDVNAVYLGTPGPNQDCPSHLIGRADTVSIGGPVTPGEPSTPARTNLRAAVGPKRAGTDMPAEPGTILESAQLRELAVAMPGSAPSITATYGTNPDLILQVLAGLHGIGPQPGAAKSAKHPPGTPAPDPWPSWTPPSWIPPSWIPPSWIPPSWTTPTPTGTPARAPAQQTPAGTPTPTDTPTSSSTPAPTQPTPAPSSPPSAPDGPLAGFDTCTAPSLQTMTAWRPKYASAAIYIGGQEMGCDYGNLSKSWVQAAEGMGWSLMPTYVGPQAPCNSFSDEISPGQAASEGQQAASQAIADAGSFGLGQGSPIYYDMEAYNETNASCVTAVLTFLDAWDRQLQASGYVSGVYSSADSGITDLQTTSTIGGHPLAEPQAIWIALWDNAANLTGSPYITSAVWPTSARSKQYAGPHTVTVGGISLNIDSDLVNGAVARG